MTKNEIIEAINATIIPNGQKGITAESLANILLEIVNATPEGGSGGSGQIVFYMGMPNEDYTECTLTPEQQAHNAEMAKIIKESPVSLAATIDYTGHMIANFPATDFSGMKYNFISMMTMYASPIVATTMGLPTEGIALAISETDQLFVAMDGSVVVFYGE
jgi:hypothetical protein